MKKFFIMALMAGLAMWSVSCSSDDDKDDNGGSSAKLGNTETGAYSKEAARYAIPVTEAPTVTIGEGTNKKEAQLTSFQLTEYGQGVVEVTVDGSKKYHTYGVKLDNNRFTLIGDDGQTVGTIDKKVAAAKTRGTSDVELIFNLTISIEINGVMVPLVFNDTAEAQEIIERTVKEITTKLTNTWEVERMKLTIVFDDKNKADASTTTTGGDLVPFINLAKKNGVNISEQDEKDLTREIKSLIIENPDLFVLKYADGRSDAATWRWVSEKVGSLAIGITLKDSEMGNKFFNNNSAINVELRKDNKVNLILQTRLEDDKCTASLLVNLK